mmetsp:Transcript_20534/g.36432  ORF Transcript_20534/g.36432 Transcript_20534/m.36432 type:complete len:229 (+) Transcript_20534:84-770(+)
MGSRLFLRQARLIRLVLCCSLAAVLLRPNRGPCLPDAFCATWQLRSLYTGRAPALSAHRVRLRAEASDTGLSREDLVKLVQGRYEDIMEVAKQPGMAARLKELAAELGGPAKMRVGLAISEAAKGSQFDVRGSDAEKARCEQRLREAVEEVQVIQEVMLFRPYCDRFASALQQAKDAGVDQAVVKELHASGLSKLKEHKKRFESIAAGGAGSWEEGEYNLNGPSKPLG